MNGLRLPFLVFCAVMSANSQETEESPEDVLSDSSLSEKIEIGELITKCKQNFPVALEDYIGKEVSHKAKCYLDCVVQDIPDASDQDYLEMGQTIMELLNVTVPGDIGLDASEQLAACVGDVEKNIEDKCEVSYQTFLCIMRMFEKIILFGLIQFV